MTYEVRDAKFLWRTETGQDDKLVAFVFDAGDAAVVASMINAALIFASLSVDEARVDEHQRRFYTWDGETDVSSGY